MKILFLTNCPSPYRIRFFNELSKYCELTVVFEMEQARNRDKLWRTDEEFQFDAIFLKSIFQKQEGAFCPQIVKYLKKFKKDIIIVGGYSTPTGMWSILYMRNHHIPFILNCDGGMIKQDNFVKYKVKKFFIGSASYWLSTGKICSKYLAHYGAEKQKIFQYPFTSIRECEIGHITDTQKKVLKDRLEIKEKIVVLFVGSFIYRKGLDVLIEACKELENVALVLVGGDNISEIWSAKDVDVKCNIYIEGFKNEQEIKQYYQVADMFVLPTREDIWGLVVNEAMAAGIPVITTSKCGAGLELIHDDQNGYIVQENAVDLLQKKIKYLSADNELREYIGQNNLAKIRNYTIEKMAERHMDIFTRITNE